MPLEITLVKLSPKLDLWLKFPKDNCYGWMSVSGRLYGPVNVNVPMSKLMCNEPETDTIIMSKVGDKWNRVTNQISTTAVRSASTFSSHPTWAAIRPRQLVNRQRLICNQNDKPTLTLQLFLSGNFTGYLLYCFTDFHYRIAPIVIAIKMLYT